MSSNGFSATTVRSAKAAAATRPTASPSRSNPELTLVVALSASAAVNPRCSTMISNSRACHSPYGVTANPLSVPTMKGTPASLALTSIREATSTSLRFMLGRHL